MKRITVISICFDNSDDVISTCKSVDMQEQKPFEHLIIDGSRGPAIKNYLENHTQPAYRRWICEKDDGISDAFNKGVLNAEGEIVVMLNSGDTFYDNLAIGTAATAFEKDNNLQWLHSKYELHRGDTWIIIGKPFAKSKMYRGMRSICHQTMFVKKTLHDKYGLYDTRLKIAMDYDFLLRIVNEKFIFIETPLVKFAPAGSSSTNYLLSLIEIKASYEKYYGKSMLLQLWQIRLKLLHYLLRTKLGKLLFKVKTGLKLENM
ncbi:MAG: glycosyltransferase [Chitinophagaceae bacterium]